MSRALLHFLALVFTAGAAGSAGAQIAVSASPAANAPALGRVVDGATATVFVVDPSTGAVTRVAGGDAVRVGGGSTTSPTVTVQCGFSLRCAYNDVRVQVSAAGASGRSSIAAFRVSDLSGTSFNSGSPPAEAASLDFQLNPVGFGRSVTFRLGLRVLVPASGAYGNETFTYVVRVTQL